MQQKTDYLVKIFELYRLKDFFPRQLDLQAINFYDLIKNSVKIVNAPLALLLPNPLDGLIRH